MTPRRASPRVVTLGVLALALIVAPLVVGDPLSLVDSLAGRNLAPDIPPPPLVTLTTPRDGDGVLGSAARLAGHARATWPGGLVRDVQFRVDDGAWTSLDVPARGAQLVPFDAPLLLAPGDHRVEARAADDHGYSAPVGVDVRAGAAAAPPTVRILAPSDGEGVLAGELDVTGTVEGLGSHRVMVALDGGAPQEATFLSADGRGALWRARLALEPGLHRIAAFAEGDDRSLPREARVSAGAEQAPPTLQVLRPEAGEGFGTGGSDACDGRCVSFVGVATGGAPRGVRVQLDDAAPVDVDDVTIQADAATWQWRLPVSGMYAGLHRARFVATGLAGESAPRDVAFLLRTTRLLHVEGDTAPEPTGTPLHFRVAGTVRNASWTLDGASAGEGLETSFTLLVPGDHTLVVATSDAQGAGAALRVPLYARDRPPVVTSVGAGTGYAGAPIGLTATATDADGTVVAYRWDFGDGSPLLETRDGEATHAWPRPGTFALRVAAVDELSAAGEPVARAVLVQDAPPSAAFSLLPQRPTRLDDVRFFDASGDADGAIVSWQWDFGDGATSTERAPVHRFLERGDLEVRLTVVDDGGEVATTMRRVHVADLPPAVDFSWAPELPDTGAPVTFTDLTTKPDGELASWRWEFGDGFTSDGRAVTHAFARPGRYAVTLVVTDDVGTRASRTRALDVRDADPLVRAILIEPDAPRAMDPVRFVADATDKEGALDRVAWEFGDNATSAEFSPVHRYARAGTYDVNLTAFDAAGNRGARSLRVHVLPAPPLVTLVPPDVAYAGFAATLRADASDADGAITRLVFDLDDDGTPECDGLEATCAWPYPSEGVYTARVDVEDDAGLVATARVLVDVLAAPVSLTPPDLVVDAPANGSRVAGQLVIAGSARSVRPIRIVEVQLRNDSWTFHDGPAPRPFHAWTPAIGTEDWGFVLDTRPFPAGAYEVAIRATDVGGGAALARVPIVIDNGPPASELALRIVDLQPMQTVDGTFLVHGSAFHPQGLASVRWRVDEGSWRPIEGPHQAFTIPLRARDLPAGAHVLEVEAYRGILDHNGTRVPFVVPEGRPTLFVDVAPAPIAYGVVAASGHAANDSVVLWRLDHRVWTPLMGNASWSLSAKTTRDDVGERTVSFKAVSLRTGQESEVLTFPVKVLDTTLASVLQESARPAKRDAPGLDVAIVLVAVLAIARLRRR